jgi:23S rRNA (cytosine1962-C5)-methyltransferase
MASVPVARVTLTKNLARSVRGGHPWVYRDALRPPSTPLSDGALVLVAARDGRPLGRGYWTATTPIAVRMLTLDAADDIEQLVAARLRAALDRRLSFLDRTRTNTFRWVHGEADLLPGVHLDIYDRHASVRFDGPGARAFYRDLPAQVMEIGRVLELVAVIERVPRGRGAATGEEDSARALVGRLPQGELEVRENGLLFGVDLLHGQKGGLFLDQRENRARVGALARGRRVLNLFGYTGGFSVFAAAGGAVETTTVDSAKGAIAAAADNFRRNGLPDTNAEFVVADAFRFLAESARAGRRWDLVISDPPSFAPNRKALPEAEAAYRRLHRLCAAVVAPAGMLCAASCSSHFGAPAFIASVEAGARDAGRRFAFGEMHEAGADHPTIDVFPEGRYLKFAVGTLD